MCGAAISSRKQPLAKRRNFGKRLALEQGRRELAGDRDRDLDGFAFKPRLDRLQRVVRFAKARGDAFERVGDAATGLDGGVALRLGVAAAVRCGFGLGELHRMLGKRDRRFAFAAGGEIDVEQEFCRCAHQ